MRNITAKDYQQMLGDRDAIIFLLDEENNELRIANQGLKDLLDTKQETIRRMTEDSSGKLVEPDTQ